jgi:capsular polysaccharide transport system permease protein
MKPFSLKLNPKTYNIVYFILVPFIVVAVYVTLYIPSQFESDSKLIIKSTSSSTPKINFGALIPSSSENLRDIIILREFLTSKNMFMRLDSALGLREIYSSAQTPWHQRLSFDADTNSFLELFNKKLSVDIDGDVGIAHIKYLSHDPQSALATINLILNISEKYIDDFNKEVVLLELKFAKKMVSDNLEKLNIANNKLIEFQNKNRVFSPQKSSENILSVLADLDSKLLNKQLALSAKTVYMKPSSIEITTLKLDISDIIKKKAEYKSRLMGDSSDLNEIIMRHEYLKQSVEIYKEAHKMSVIHMAETQSSATKKLRVIVFISKPLLPDANSYPNIIYILTNTLLILLLMYGIIRILIETVRDHKD